MDVTQIPRCTSQDVDAAVFSAKTAFVDRRWSGLSGADRAAVCCGTFVSAWKILSVGSVGQVNQFRRSEVRLVAVSACLNMPVALPKVCMVIANSLGDGMFGIVTREPVGVSD